MIKILVTDLDGTFLNNDRVPTKENIQALKEASKKCLICLATGRPLSGISKILDLLDFGDLGVYLITNTGANLYDFKKKKLLFKERLGMDIIGRLKQIAEKNEVLIAGYTEDLLYSLSGQANEALIHDSKILKMQIIYQVPQETEFSRINFMGQKANLDKVMEEVKKKFGNEYYLVRNEDFSFEVLNSNAGKANALKWLANYLNIDLMTESFIIGDNYNDLEMLMLSNTSVAMGQSAMDIKKIAKYVAASNEDSGFASAVYEYVLKEESK